MEVSEIIIKNIDIDFIFYKEKTAEFIRLLKSYYQKLSKETNSEEILKEKNKIYKFYIENIVDKSIDLSVERYKKLISSKRKELNGLEEEEVRKREELIMLEENDEKFKTIETLTNSLLNLGSGFNYGEKELEKSFSNLEDLFSKLKDLYSIKEIMDLLCFQLKLKQADEKNDSKVLLSKFIEYILSSAPNDISLKESEKSFSEIKDEVKKLLLNYSYKRLNFLKGLRRIFKNLQIEMEQKIAEVNIRKKEICEYLDITEKKRKQVDNLKSKIDNFEEEREKILKYTFSVLMDRAINSENNKKVIEQLDANASDFPKKVENLWNDLKKHCEEKIESHILSEEDIKSEIKETENRINDNRSDHKEDYEILKKQNGLSYLAQLGSELESLKSLFTKNSKQFVSVLELITSISEVVKDRKGRVGTEYIDEIKYLINRSFEDKGLQKSVVTNNTIYINGAMLESMDELSDILKILSKETGVKFVINENITKLQPDIFDPSVFNKIVEQINSSEKCSKYLEVLDEFRSHHKIITDCMKSYKFNQQLLNSLSSCDPELIENKLDILKTNEINEYNFFQRKPYLIPSDINSLKHKCKQTDTNVNDVFNLLSGKTMNSLKQKFPKIFDFNSKSTSELNKNNKDNEGYGEDRAQKDRGVDELNIK